MVLGGHSFARERKAREREPAREMWRGRLVESERDAGWGFGSPVERER